MNLLIFSYFIKGEYEAVYKKTFKGEFSGLEEVKKHVNLFNDTFDGYKNLKLISQVCMGEQREFLWSIELNGKEYVRSFRFSKKGKGSLEYLIKNTSISISPLLRKVYQFSLNDEVLESSGNISHPVLDEDGSFPFMILLGDGRKFNYRISDINSIDETKFLNKAVKAYLTIYSFLLEKRKKDFLMYLTKNSSKKAKEWLFSMSHDVYNSYLMSLKKRKVYYSINAYPYVIIFYEEVMQGSNEKVFRHEYLVKDDNSEYGFLLTNFYYEDFLDDVFNSKEKFIMGLKEIQ